MSRPITISLSPNTEGDDIALAWHVLINPTHWYYEPALPKAAGMLSRHVGNRFITLTSSGRSALHSLLKAWRITKGDEVIIQAYTCIAVAEPILWVGATPIYADISPRTFNMNVEDVKKKITSRTKVIIIQHTFGIPGPIDELKQLAQEKHIRVIEDCAHGFGGTYKGQPLGTLADAAILSFGRDKTISTVYGGAAVAPDQGLHMQLHGIQQTMYAPPATWIIQQLLHPIIFYFALPVYFRFAIGQRMIRLAQMAGILSKAVTAGERQGKRPAHIAWRYAPALAHLLQNQIAKIEEFTNRRQSIAQQYFTGLSKFEFSLPKVPTNSSPAWLRFPILVKNRDEVLREARQQGILLGDWYDAALVPKDFAAHIFQYQAGSCPQAEEAAAHTINLPTYPTMTDKQVHRVIEFTIKHAQPYYETR